MNLSLLLYMILKFDGVTTSQGGLLLVCDGGSDTVYFQKTQKYIKFRTVLDAKIILIASWYMKTNSFIEFSATAPQYFGEKLSLAPILSYFLIINPKTY